MLPKLKLGHQLLPKPIQMRLSGQLETTTKMRTMQTFLEIHLLSKISMVKLLLEKSLIDGKVTQITLDQPSSQLLKTLPKLKQDHQLLLKKVIHNQSIALIAITKQPTTTTSPEIKLS
jgi:hypothetical protein